MEPTHDMQKFPITDEDEEDKSVKVEYTPYDKLVPLKEPEKDMAFVLANINTLDWKIIFSNSTLQSVRSVLLF